MKRNIFVNEYYHIYNRGNNKQSVFLDEKDWARFLFLIIYMQSPTMLFNIGQEIPYFIRHRMFNISKKKHKTILENRTTELTAFAFMPNHFHLIIKESSEKGISRYMQRIQDGYTKYFNTRYKRIGHLFQGPFHIVHVKDNEQLLHLSAYIHRNPRELNEWKNQEHQFPWSSFQDYVVKNRWGELLKHGIITEQFSTGNEYKLFTDTSGTKLDITDEKHLKY